MYDIDKDLVKSDKESSWNQKIGTIINYDWKGLEGTQVHYLSNEIIVLFFFSFLRNDFYSTKVNRAKVKCEEFYHK